MDPLIGATLGGRYTIRRLLARGGVGLVYLAQQRDPDREVVVKVLAPAWIDNPEAVARFQREGQRLGAVQHPNIVSLYECGHENGVAYLVMEHLVGELLSDLVVRKGGHLGIEEFVPIAAQILKGLGYAHSRGMMHRDIKPSNIMLCVRKGRANFVKILDFGMAKLIAGEQDITAEQIVGTANYLSPEQIKGEPVDARVDVYSLGVLFYGLLSGRMPFEADNNAAILYKHVNVAPRPLAEVLPPGHLVPAGLVELIMLCLEKDPEARPADADAMVEALIDCVQASMFHLPLADGTTGMLLSSSSMASPMSTTGLHHSPLTASSSTVASPMTSTATAALEGTQTEVSSANLSLASALAAGRERPPTNPRIRPPTHPRIRPPTHPRIRPPSAAMSAASGLGPDHTIPTLEADTVASPRGNWGLIFGALAALLAGGLLTAVYVLSRPPTPEPVAAAATATDPQSRARAAQTLDRVDADILAGDFEGARASLDEAAVDIDAVPEFRLRAGRQRDRIAVATTFANAQRLEKDGKAAAALGAYQDILAIDPGHLDARAAVNRLREAAAGPTVHLPAQPADVKPTVRRPGRPGKPGEPAPATPATTAGAPEPAAETPEPQATPKEDDMFLPVAKKDDGSIFLPVGGKK